MSQDVTSRVNVVSGTRTVEIHPFSIVSHAGVLTYNGGTVHANEENSDYYVAVTYVGLVPTGAALIHSYGDSNTIYLARIWVRGGKIVSITDYDNAPYAYDLSQTIAALTARVTALETATADAVIYIGSFSNMQDFTPVPAYADYLCFNENVGNAGQLWRWTRGSTAAVNGVTVVADPNPSTGRFILTSTF